MKKFEKFEIENLKNIKGGVDALSTTDIIVDESIVIDPTDEKKTQTDHLGRFHFRQY